MNEEIYWTIAYWMLKKTLGCTALTVMMMTKVTMML